jgi:hypothetical protein
LGDARCDLFRVKESKSQLGYLAMKLCLDNVSRHIMQSEKEITNMYVWTLAFKYWGHEETETEMKN